MIFFSSRRDHNYYNYDSYDYYEYNHHYHNHHYYNHHYYNYNYYNYDDYYNYPGTPWLDPCPQDQVLLCCLRRPGLDLS